MAHHSKQSPPQLVAQLLLNFVLPIIVLTRFSSTSSLGPTKSLLLALSLPISYELYNVVKNRRISRVSIISISGILVTGSISLLKLSVAWLAFRRSVPYVFVSFGIITAQLLNYSPAQQLAQQIFDMKKIKKATKDPEKKLQTLFKKCSYAAAALFAIVAVVSYALTRAVVTAKLDTTEFNQQYAQLRLWSLLSVTVPIVVGTVGLVWYLVGRLEKETGLAAEELMRH